MVSRHALPHKPESAQARHLVLVEDGLRAAVFPPRPRRRAGALAAPDAAPRRRHGRVGGSGDRRAELP